MSTKRLSLAQMKQALAASKPAKTRAALMKRLVVPEQFKSGHTYSPPSKLKTLTGRGDKVPLVKPTKLPSISPCPFCKSKSVEAESGVTYAYVKCHDCYAHGPRVFYAVGAKTTEMATAVKLWNTAK